jgi:hypothetical protein
MDVDAISQRTGDSRAVAGNLGRVAGASTAEVPEMAAGAWIHRSHEHETRWKRDSIPGSDNGDPPIFHGLPQDFQDTPGELG